MRHQSTRPAAGFDHRSVLCYDIETISTDEPLDGSFPPWPTHQPIALGLVKAEYQEGGWAFDLDTIVAAPGEDADLLKGFEERLGGIGTVVTYNGRGFDAPVLQLAAMRKRRFDLPHLAAHVSSHRFGFEHADLAELYSAYGATRKVTLAAICHELGIPVKTNVQGSDVAELWRSGDIDNIRAYVLEDTVATLIAWWAYIAFRGADEALITQPLAALAAHIERSPNLAALQPFVECELSRWARPRAMRANVAAALNRIQTKLKHIDEERGFAAADA